MSVLVSVTPRWFHGVDATLELFSVIIALLIAYAGYKAFRVSGLRRYLAVGSGFFLLAGAYAARMGTELLMYLEKLSDFRQAVEEGASIHPTFLVGRFFYIVIVLFAYLLLVTAVLRIDQPKLLALLGGLLALLAWQVHTYPTTTGYYLIVIWLLLFITQHLLQNSFNSGTKSSAYTFLAFGFFLIEAIVFLLANWISPLYMVAYLFRFIGDVFLLTSLVKVLRA